VRELTLTVPATAVEEVLDALMALAPHGVYEVPRGDDVELRVRGAADELPSPSAVAAAGGRWRASLREREVADDWRTRRLADHESVLIAGRIVVRPDWAPAIPGLLDVVLADDGAFGAGGHPTTHACLEALCALAPAGAALDLGCGSGVLAIAAALLGWGPVVAVDREPAAVAATRTNARRSGAAVDVREQDVAAAARLPAALVIANVPLPAHREIARALPAPPQRLIASGVLAGDADELFELYALPPTASVIADGGWATVVSPPEAAR